MVAVFLTGTLAWGARHARRAGRSSEEFFAAGRRLPWWLAGTSIVATTFAVDTPLAIAGLVATGGLAANWFWWADVLPAMIGALLIAHLWRRSGVLTDNELIELRYGGRPAAGLRAFRALYWGVLRNAIVIGWVNLAMLKVLELALGLEPEQGRWVLAGLFGLTLGYTLLSGLVGVVLTDLLQFVLALGGSLLLAVLALRSAGGPAGLVESLVLLKGSEGAARTLSLLPQGGEDLWAFVIYVAVKSWSSGNTEGSGYIAQRLLATRDERHARLAALWYAVANFVLRPWPWILVGLFALVRYPELPDPETGYVRVMLDLLPAGVRGLLLASLLAAFMSTVDTQLNWGASYLTHDLYRRFFRPDASERELVRTARASVVGLAALGVCATLGMPSIAGAWKFLASITAGTGLIVLLRWLWWRINAWSEISVMAASLFAANGLLLFTEIPFPFSLAIVVAVAVPVSLATTLLTPPESAERLARFHVRVRPRGWWGPVAAQLGDPPRRLGSRVWLGVAAGTLGTYSLLLGSGELLLGSRATGALAAALGLSLLAAVVTSRSRSAPRRRRSPPPV
ncbi:MAG: sodium:solute symporter family protein [Myxococcota bacterium]